MLGNLLNLVLFKAGWVACVVFAARDLPVLASVAVAVVVTLHLLRVAVPVKEAVFLSAAALLGLGWESLVLASGVLEYRPSSASGGWAPHWIVAMWMLFATTINHGFRWIKRSWILAAGMGLVGGPLAFVAGAGLGAVAFTDTFAAIALIGAGWMVLLPILVLIADTIIDSEFLEPAGVRTSTRAALLGLVRRPGSHA
jgi:hypothetical protein